MNRVGFCALILLGTFCFSEGKPCPEKTRPHKTRCEIFYKCIELPSKMHVWVPERCDKGLVFEPNLRMCVLPGDDWECLLGDGGSLEVQARINENINKTQDIHIVNEQSGAIAGDRGKPHNDAEMIVVGTAEDIDDDSDEYDGSGDDRGQLVELDGFLSAEIHSEGHEETTVEPTESTKIETLPPELEPEMKTTPSLAESPKIDPKLTEHLQRLSQLIDGLQQTYKTHEQNQQSLRPDQLNAFLAHFNIKNKFEALPMSVGQDAEGDYVPTPLSSTTPAPWRSEVPQPSLNKTLLQEHLSATTSGLQPETKGVLTSHSPQPYGSNGEYSNSQIVVNRPEGSVLFNLPPQASSQGYGSGPHTHFANSQSQHYNSPKISEETLQTVLELSKQMIANQNVPKIIPNPAGAYYAQPYLQPVFLPPPSGASNPFNAYYGHHNVPSSYERPPSHHRKHSRPHNNGGATIIHNVIPVHLSPNNGGDKDLVDSYGQSLDLYPPLGGEDPNGSGTINHLHHHSHRYETNKYITSVTTMRPTISSTTPATMQYMSSTAHPTATTIADYYTPSPHLSNSNVNNLFHTTSEQLYPTVSANLPRPMEGYGNTAHAYQQAPHSALFPPQINANKVNIRPNSQKIESQEMLDGDDDADDYVTSYNQPPPQRPNRRKQQQQQQQTLTYNYDDGSDEKPYVTSQLASHTHSHSNSKPPLNPHYMPRPTATSNNYGHRPSSQSYGGGGTTAGGAQQLINVGGNFISYDLFQQSVLPLLSHSHAAALPDFSGVEVITCTPGVRQPNSTDCTRYYVCSKKDGKVLSYSCPPYTAFNQQTRICDAQTYAQCSGEPTVMHGYSVADNKRRQMEALQALQDAKRRRQEQAQKLQNMNNLLSQFGGLSSTTSVEENMSTASGEKDMLSAYIQQAAMMVGSSTTTARPPGKKRKYYCKEGDKIADQTSVHTYFVCYKNAQGMMKGHKMTCSKGLIFCPKSTMCTLSSKCA